MDYNLILDTDSYKASHWQQYPPGTHYMFNYLESRGGMFPSVLFFGLQYLLKAYLAEPIKPYMVDEAEDFFLAHGLPFNREGWMYIARTLKGKLPIIIKAVDEGTVVGNHNVLMTIESTDPKVFWLPSYLETLMLRIWYPITVATLSFQMKKLLAEGLLKTADKPFAELDYKLHDFGSRGVSSAESAAIGAMAHLVNFKGSDTVIGVRAANHYYEHPMAARSIPAAEHSTITAWGAERECDAYANILQLFAKPGNVVAVVSDSYDLYHAVEHLWGETLRQQVIDSGATLIVRPDSGNPSQTVLDTLELLDSRFGSKTNNKGYRVLNHVRVIQGDGLDHDALEPIIVRVIQAGFCLSNVYFGMGGGLLQKVNRDTQRFAIKCSAVMIDGQEIPVYKHPKTDPDKQSKRGRLELIETEDGFRTVNMYDPDVMRYGSRLRTVYKNGVITRTTTLTNIRSLADCSLREAARAFDRPVLV